MLPWTAQNPHAPTSSPHASTHTHAARTRYTRSLTTTLLLLLTRILSSSSYSCPFPALALVSLLRSLIRQSHARTHARHTLALSFIAALLSFRAAHSCISSDHAYRAFLYSGSYFFSRPVRDTSILALTAQCCRLASRLAHALHFLSSCLNVAARLCDVSGCAAALDPGGLITISVGHVEVRQQRIS
jgi:hypothetical protein